jgi:hypothetical protein
VAFKKVITLFRERWHNSNSLPSSVASPVAADGRIHAARETGTIGALPRFYKPALHNRSIH